MQQQRCDALLAEELADVGVAGADHIGLHGGGDCEVAEAGAGEAVQDPPPDFLQDGIERFGLLRRVSASPGTFHRRLERDVLEIDGVIVAGIQTIEGIESETEIVEYKDGSDPVTHARPGNHKPGKMTVTKDWSNTQEFFKWRKTVLDGKVERKSISIVFQNDAGEVATRMNFFQCWPVKWTGPAMNAKNSGHATEVLEIVWERIEIK